MATNGTVINSITPQIFSNYFLSSFILVQTWSSTTTYNAGDQVYNPNDGNYYISLISNNLNNIPNLMTLPASWNKLQYNNKFVTDNSILQAMGEASAIFDMSLMPATVTTDGSIPILDGTPPQSTIVGGYSQPQIGFMYLTAHYLITDIKNSNSSGASEFLNSSSGTGVTKNNHIPDFMKGELSLFATTSYGQRYILMIKPQMRVRTLPTPVAGYMDCLQEQIIIYFNN